MPMRKFRDSLKELHSEIDKTDLQELNAKGEQIGEKIKQVLDNPSDSPDESHHNLTEDLQESIQLFEIEHPAITDLINKAIEAFHNIGI